MNTQDPVAFRKHIRIYLGVFVALLAATLLTVAISYVHFGHAGNIAVALVIAALKAALVAGFFMHLLSEKKSIYTVLGFTAFFFLGLLVLTVWSMQDHPELTASLPPPLPATAGTHHVP